MTCSVAGRAQIITEIEQEPVARWKPQTLTVEEQVIQKEQIAGLVQRWRRFPKGTAAVMELAAMGYAYHEIRPILERESIVRCNAVTISRHHALSLQLLKAWAELREK